AKSRDVETKFQDIFARGPAGWRWAALLSGSIVGSLADPLNASTMLLGPGGRVGVGAASVIWMAIKQAVANATVEAVQQPAVQHWRARAGLDHGLGPALADIGMA